MSKPPRIRAADANRLPGRIAGAVRAAGAGPRPAGARGTPITAISLAVRMALGMLALASAGHCWSQEGVTVKRKEADEFATFRLTGVDGYVQLRYLSDESRAYGQENVPDSRSRQTSLIEEVFLMTHSYVYHPSLLTLDIGGGPVFNRSSYDVDGTSTDSRNPMYNFSMRANILKDKPYTGALFYERRNETQGIGPAEEILTKNTRYGFNFAALNPAVKTPLHVDFTRSSNRGRGATQLIDDNTDQFRLKLDANIGKDGSTALQYVGTRQDSASGSVFLPILTSESSNHSATLDTRMKFGEKGETDFNNVITLNSNQYSIGGDAPIRLRDYIVGFDLRKRHSDTLQTFGHYNYNASRQDDQSMVLNAANAGLSYSLSDEVSTALSGHAERTHATQFSSTLYGVDGSVQYRRALLWGQGTASYNFSYSKHDQQATASQAKMLGEHVVFLGTAYVTLGKPQIVATTVVVTNLTRSQTFVEGVDYTLTEAGINLRIQRLVGGSIADGQEVLVNYEYLVGGSYVIGQLDNTFGLAWAYKNYFNTYARYYDSNPRLESGAPTVPINVIKSKTVGMQAQYPLSVLASEWIFGGNAEREDRRETILPYKRSSNEVFFQFDLPFVRSGNLRLGQRRMKINYDENPNLDVDLKALDLHLWARMIFGIEFYVDASRERDTGGPLVRERTYTSAKAQWRQRKLSWSFNLTRLRDAQGSAVRSRNYGQILLRRDI